VEKFKQCRPFNGPPVLKKVRASAGNNEPTAFAGYGASLKGQLDLFAHSRTVVLVNDLVDSLLARNTGRICERMQLLRAEAPGHPALSALATLHGALERWPVSAAGAADSQRVVEWLDYEVAAAATVFLGDAAPNFMRSLWRELAIIVADHQYDPAHPQAHRAYCLLRAGDAAAALRAATTIEGFEHDPFVLEWVTLASYLLHGCHASRVAFFALVLNSPQRVPATLKALADASLYGAWERFWLDCAWLDPHEVSSGGWFPAWYLIEHPATHIGRAVIVADPAAPPVRALETLRRLLTLEPSGYSGPLIAARTELQAIDARLFRHYMSRREL
jgi:hypothetical protein